MYWKVDTTKIDGQDYITYNYYSIVDTEPTKPPIWNPFTQSFIYPETKYIVIKAIIVDSEEQFLNYYDQEKNL